MLALLCLSNPHPVKGHVHYYDDLDDHDDHDDHDHDHEENGDHYLSQSEKSNIVVDTVCVVIRPLDHPLHSDRLTRDVIIFAIIIIIITIIIFTFA